MNADKNLALTKSAPTRYPKHRAKVMKGNFAAAEAARLCRVGFVPAYPITPQTTIVERLSELAATGELAATYINMDSEHSVFAAAMGAAIAGERVFTATAGQGLFYAHEVLQAIAHFRLPMVVCNVGRPSIPWNIWSDQSDSLSQRDAGWVQFYGESAQEVLDSVIQGYRLTEQLNIPVMVVLDAFYQSHTSENVWLPEQELVDAFLPPPAIQGLDREKPASFGGLMKPEHYNALNYQQWRDAQRVEETAERIAEAFGRQFGRNYGNVEAVNIGPDTRLILVTASSVTSTARGVIRTLPEVGLLKLRLFRPFPIAAVQRALASAPEDTPLAIIERNFLGDREGALMQELKRALYGSRRPLYDFFLGVGGVDIPPSAVEEVIYRSVNNPQEVTWITGA